MEHKETGCQTPEGPILCINNCGFFGSAATMSMCSKCHKEMVLKQERAELAASSIGNLVNGSSSSSSGKGILVTSGNVDLSVAAAEENTVIYAPSDALALNKGDEATPKGPSRCHSCKKRVGLAGFNCRCGNTFCGVHRYSEKHECTFDYRTEARGAIAKANPVVKAEKLDKI